MSSIVLVTVVIPCYNAADTLGRAVASILSQGMYGTEIIIVDDASTDGSRDVASKLATESSEIRVIHHESNSGPAASRNTGLRRAQGRFVCFLDADDEYAPNCFSTLLPILQSHSDLAWVSMGIELVNCHRPVHPVQLDAIAASMPSNIIARTVAAELIGGFPENHVFRGRSAGEDIVYRMSLKQYFQGRHRFEKFLRHWVHPGSHFDFFLDRSTVENGELVFKYKSDDETNGDLAAAQRQHADRVADRISVVGSLRNIEHASPQFATAIIKSAEVYESLKSQFEGIQGFLHPNEGYALYRLAMNGPGHGAIVEIGSLFGRSTCWLAAGTRDAGSEKVVAVDHFRGSPEHQEGGNNSISEVASGGTTFPKFMANMQMHGLRDWIDVRTGASAQIAPTWKGPIRLLFIDGDHSYEATKADFEAWSNHIVPGGLVAFHDVDIWPGVTAFYRELQNENRAWIEVNRTRSLRVIQRK